LTVGPFPPALRSPCARNETVFVSANSGQLDKTNMPKRA
jgi:hypothetical protein